MLARTWTCIVRGAFVGAVDLKDSKKGTPPTTCSLLPCKRPTTLYCFVCFRVNNDVWSFLYYVEDICWSFSSPFLQIFYPNLLLLLLHKLYSSCFYIKPVFPFLMLSVPIARCDLRPPISMSCRHHIFYRKNNNELYLFYDHITVCSTDPLIMYVL